MYGDSYLSLDFSTAMRYFQSRNRLALMTIYKNYDHYDRSNTAVEENLVPKYSKQEKTRDMLYIDYGANIFRKKILDMIPENQFYFLEDIFSRLIEMRRLHAFEVKERFYEIGSPEGLNDFKECIRGAR